MNKNKTPKVLKTYCMQHKKMMLLIVIFSMVFIQSEGQPANIINKPNRSDVLELKGKINGLNEGESVSLKIYDPELGSTVSIDTATVRNGEFNFRYHIENGPRLFHIFFSKHPQLLAIPFNNEKVTMTLKRNISELRGNIFQYLTIEGSSIVSVFSYLCWGIAMQWDLTSSGIQIEISAFKASALSKNNLVFISSLIKAQEIVDESAGALSNIHAALPMVPELFDNVDLRGQHSRFFPKLFEDLDEDTKNSYYGKLMKDKMYLCNGQPAPDFSLTDSNGKKISLNEIIKKNKLTVLHFWSGNSKDRARIHNELVTAYKKYRNKGMEVVNVSLEGNEQVWKRVINSDRIPGYQYCDFRMAGGDVAKTYKIQSDWTVNILIDQSGKMIGWDVDGMAFFGHLYKIFGE
jgi:peroxiredoxin